MVRALRRLVDRIALRDRQYRFLFRDQETIEAISLDCETTGFDPWVDEVVSIAAIPIRGPRILTSQAFRAIVRPETAMSARSIRVHQLREKDVEQGRPMREVLPELLRFIGARPLVGYWIDFDVRMLDKYLIEMLNIHLPNRRYDVSKLYYDRKYGNAPPGTRIDLSLASIRSDLHLPLLPQHDAFNDALSAAQMCVVLKDMAARHARIPRERGSNDNLAFAVG
jgi:DNA polymerase III subunit epsilon